MALRRGKSTGERIVRAFVQPADRLAVVALLIDFEKGADQTFRR